MTCFRSPRSSLSGSNVVLCVSAYWALALGTYCVSTSCCRHWHKSRRQNRHSAPIRGFHFSKGDNTQISQTHHISDGDTSFRGKLRGRSGRVDTSVVVGVEVTVDNVTNVIVRFLLLVKSGLPNSVSFPFMFYKLFLLNKGNKQQQQHKHL